VATRQPKTRKKTTGLKGEAKAPPSPARRKKAQESETHETHVKRIRRASSAAPKGKASPTGKTGSPGAKEKGSHLQKPEAAAKSHVAASPRKRRQSGDHASEAMSNGRAQGKPSRRTALRASGNGRAARFASPEGRSAQRSEPAGAGASASTPAASPAASKPSRSDSEDMMFQRLFANLDAFARQHNHGQVVADQQFEWGLGEEVDTTGLNPDLAFVSYERWAPYRNVPRGHTWHVVPELVVEIVRESEHTLPIGSWLDAYFRSGVRRVWVVYPHQLKIHDYESLSTSRVIDRKDQLDGGDVLPGFRLAVRDLAEAR
jgi:hypothetical protein